MKGLLIMASFQKYKTKNGDMWMFKIYTDINPRTGKRKTTTRRGFKSKGDAQTASRQMENDLSDGLGFNNNPITFNEFSKKWLVMYEDENGVKPGTIRIRNHEMNNLKTHFGNIKMIDISWQQYQKVLHELHQRFAKNTLDGIHRTGRMIFKKAMQLDIIKKDPTEYAYLPKKVATVEDLENAIDLPKYMEKEELAVFLEVSLNQGLGMDFEIFLTLAYTGLRVGELCPLKESDIYATDEYLLKVSKTYYNPTNNIKKYEIVTPKTLTSRRTIDIDGMVYNALMKLVDRNNEMKKELKNEYYDQSFIFASNGKYPGYPIYTKIIQQRMKRILKLAGLNENLTPHSLRHTHTSLLSEAGLSIERIMERLGHSDDDTTKKIYLHTTQAVRKRDSEKFGSLMKNVLKFDK